MKVNLLIIIRYRDEITSQTQVYETREAADAAVTKFRQSSQQMTGVSISTIITSGAA